MDAKSLPSSKYQLQGCRNNLYEFLLRAQAESHRLVGGQLRGCQEPPTTSKCPLHGCRNNLYEFLLRAQAESHWLGGRQLRGWQEPPTTSNQVNAHFIAAEITFMNSCSGHRQSPIDLEEDNCVDAKSLPPLAIKYTPTAGLRLENTGFSWKVGFRTYCKNCPNIWKPLEE